VNPDDYQSIIVDLSDGAHNYVKAGGNVSVVLEIKEGEKFWVGEGYAYLGNDFESDRVNLTKLSGDTYFAGFTAPEEPGVYKESVSRITAVDDWTIVKEYNLTVISEVNETEAYGVVYSFVLDRNMRRDVELEFPYYDCGHGMVWVISEEAVETETCWDITMKTWYKMYICAHYDPTGGGMANNTITGHYIVDKQTGLIIG
jgi:hypothetical protein